MIVSTYRPYFAPFPGFFQKAMLSDVLVLLDCVQFPRGTTWLNRNRFKNDQGTYWMTVPVWKKGLGLQKIDEVKIYTEGSWAMKHLASLKSAYAKAPFFEEHEPFFEGLFSGVPEKLLDMNLMIFRHIMASLEIPTRVVLLSELEITAKEPDLSMTICRELGATCFLAQASAGKYLPGELFERHGVELRFFRPRPVVYPQLWGPFIGNLSTLDLLFNCGPGSRRILEKALPDRP
ncbi:MAG: WbqC family protein [Deltaproteobacteria bacterium]|nr:WbqC family protein [Deltaproteobacteria bacterium]